LAQLEKARGYSARQDGEPQAVFDVSALIERQKLGRFLVELVTISWTITFFDGFDMNVIAFAAPYLSTEFHLERVMMGNVLSIGLLGTMVGGFLFGWIGDRFGRRPAVMLSTVLFGLFTLALALANSYPALLALRFFDGIAAGGMLPLAWALNIEYASKRYRATIVTLVMIGYSLGISLGGPVANWLIPRFGWQAVFVFGGTLSLAAAAVLVFMLPESVRFLTSAGGKAEDIARILRRLAPHETIPATARFVLSDEATKEAGFHPRMLFLGELRWITPLLWLAYIFSSMTAFFLVTWTPLVFEALQFSRNEAATAASVNAAMGAVGGLLLMRFTDRLGAIAIVVMPICAIPLLLTVGLSQLPQAVFLILNALISLTLIGGHFGMHSIAGIFYPSAYRGSGAGWATSVAKIGSILGPWVGGVILASGLPVRHIFAVLAVCPTGVLVCIFLLGRLHSRLKRREIMHAPPGEAGLAA
jgi:AAHS family 4-hydroxybenzoate transporter-like MFS transporter